MNSTRFYLFIFLCLSTLFSYSQIFDSSLKSVQQLPDKYYTNVNKKINEVDDRITKKSLKYLARFQRQDESIQRKIQKLNGDSLSTTLANVKEKYNKLAQKLKGKAESATKVLGGTYNPYLDSLGTSLSFLKQFKGLENKVKAPLANLNQLQSRLEQTQKIQEFIAERKNQIKEVLLKYTKLPGGLKNEYDKLNKTAYYYSAKLKEYKDMLKDPQKAEQNALNILSKLPAFQKFMKQNGQLNSLFGQPYDNGIVQGLAGLQTRSSIQAIIQQKIAGGGQIAQAQIQANLAAAHAEFNKLKDKLNVAGGGARELAGPDFKPNNQKTKTFLKRLEYSADFQFEKASNLLPSSANIGLGAGYKLNDKSAIGLGMSYLLGMGNIKHISFTSQGIGVRGYVDWKLKKQIYATGGYELNYNTSFKNIEQLKNYNAWQRSALLGISKKYKISKKVQGEMKVLYDFLANQHLPVTQPILFRLGYKL